MKSWPKNGICVRLVLCISIMIFGFPALAGNNEDSGSPVGPWNSAKPVKTEPPLYPGTAARKGGEGWVLISLMLTPDGSVDNPIVFSSSGGPGFERSALRAIRQWQFEPSVQGSIDRCVIQKITFELEPKDFAPAPHDEISTLIDAGKLDEAGLKLDALFASESYSNLETAQLWLLDYRLKAKQGQRQDSYRSLRRAWSGAAASLKNKAKVDVLASLFANEVSLGLYAVALRTHNALTDLKVDKERREIVSNLNEQLQLSILSEQPIAVEASIKRTCDDCRIGPALWQHKVFRDEFKFQDIRGGLSKFELRCSKYRLRDNVSTEKSWRILEDWGNCDIFVFGHEDTTFKFVEYAS